MFPLNLAARCEIVRASVEDSYQPVYLTRLFAEALESWPSEERQEDITDAQTDRRFHRACNSKRTFFNLLKLFERLLVVLRTLFNPCHAE